jgi:HEAT repeat protein
LLPYLQHAEGTIREVLGRVFGEVAKPSLGTDVLQFVDDDLHELRAAAARALSNAEPGLAVNVLSELAQDSVWFVRLRAIVSLGKLGHIDGIPSLLRGLTDSNRLVRLRAAEGLIDLKTEMAPIFERVVAAEDRYGLHAYLTALENAGMRTKLEAELKSVAEVGVGPDSKRILLEVVRTGALPPHPPTPERAKAAARS